jgi:NAD(P)H-dependent flavin oxidoreductase YrpB (nitropropane dioxygenase family)
LIKETYDIKAKYNLSTKIIADGGFKNYSDIIKAIVLGADFVMVGGELNKLTDTQNYGYLYNKFVVSGKVKQMAHRLKLPVYHDYRGMSTKLVQQMENKKKLVTSEGISKRNLSKSTLHQWTQNFTDYLRSAMSYSNCRTLEEFIGNQNYVLISQNSYKRFNK